MCREPVGSSSTFNDVDIDFRISGLPHSVVKQAENSRVRELVKKIENHPHRQDLQADLQQNNAYNPFSEKSKKMIEGHGQCRAIWVGRRQILKCSAKNAFFTGIKASFIALAGISWNKVKPIEAPFNVHWTFSQFKILSLRRDDLMVIDMGRLKNKETIILPIIWERDASRGILKGFTIVSWKIPYFVNLNSNMIELKKPVSRWTRTHRKISPIEWRKKSTVDTERIGGSLSINLEKSDRWEIVLTSTMRWPH